MAKQDKFLSFPLRLPQELDRLFDEMIHRPWGFNPITAQSPSEGHEHDAEEHCNCPYCDEEIVDKSLPYCQACKAELTTCPECGKPMAKDDKACKNCGAKVQS